MADNNPTSPGSSTNNQNGSAPKQGGLSWSTPSAGTPPQSQAKPASTSASTSPASPLMPASAKPAQAKPAASSSPMQQKKNVARSDADSSRRLALIVGAVVVVVLLIGAWLTWGTGNSSNMASSTDEMMGSSTTTGTDMTGVPTGSPSTNSNGGLTIPSPQSAGLSVALSSITVAQPTWVVVYDSLNGAPGRALGATLFFPETNGKAGTVSLLRATTPGQTYFIGESVDSGDRVFSLHGDQQLTGSDGKVVWYSFTAQ